jgi:hypothetical protein
MEEKIRVGLLSSLKIPEDFQKESQKLLFSEYFLDF